MAAKHSHQAVKEASPVQDLPAGTTTLSRDGDIRSGTSSPLSRPVLPRLLVDGSYKRNPRPRPYPQGLSRRAQPQTEITKGALQHHRSQSLRPTAKSPTLRTHRAMSAEQEPFSSPTPLVASIPSIIVSPPPPPPGSPSVPTKDHLETVIPSIVVNDWDTESHPLRKAL